MTASVATLHESLHTLTSMSTGRVIAAAAGLLLVVAYAAGSSLWVGTGSAWYNGLARPPWMPPNWVFGVIWPYNFVMLGVAMVLVAQRRPWGEVLVGLGAFALSVTAALLWSYLFYGPHRLVESSVSLACAAALTLPVLVVTFRASSVAGLLLVPYQVWICLATALSWAFTRLNP